MAEEKSEQAAGEKTGRKPWTLREVGGKTVWDWLHLLSSLAIPVVLAVVGFWFTAQQDARQQQIEDQRAKQAQKIENQRAERDRELEEQRAQDLALQGYLDQMSSLVLDDLSDPKVQTLLRARTLTVLRRLDPSRKEEVMQFLLEADLVHRVGERDPVIDLSRADLSKTDLSPAYLSGADLSDANLRGAAGWTPEQLREAESLEGATMPNGQKYEDWLFRRGDDG